MAQIHWANQVNGSFSDALDWSGGVAPGISDNAILDASGAAFTVNSGYNESVYSLSNREKRHARHHIRDVHRPPAGPALA